MLCDYYSLLLSNLVALLVYFQENIVLFIQYKPSEKSKTYLKFEDPKECIVYIFKKCAKDLKIGESGDKVTIEYEQICDYIDDVSIYTSY